MEIKIWYRTDPKRPIEAPNLKSTDTVKWVFRLVSGTWLDPILSWGSNWFHPPYPKSVLRVYSHIPLPFVCFKWPFLARCCYFGWKVYGVDAPEYKEWLVPSCEVYEGSKALCLSFRPFASIK